MRTGAVIDHAAFNAADPAWYVEFFRAVFGMEVVREVRDETGALRQVWLDGGVQIDCGEERPNGLITHLSLRTPDMALAVQDALARGAAGVEAGVRDKVKIMIGGAPVTEAFGQSINADAYTPDAATCAEVAMQLLAS